MRMQFGEYLNDLADDIAHDLVIRVEQVVAAHARLARDSGRNHDYVGVRRIRVIIRAQNVRVALLDRHRLRQIKSLTLGNALDNIDQHYICMFLRRQPMCRRGAHIA